MSNELRIENYYTSTTELKDTAPTMTGLRIYKSSPKRITVQIRSFGATNESGNGVSRHMVSNLTIDRSEADMLATQLRILADSLNGKAGA